MLSFLAARNLLAMLASRLSYLLLNPALSEEASVVIVTPVLRLQNLVSENLLENDDKY